MERREKGAALRGVWVVEQCRFAFQTLTLGGREPGVLRGGRQQARARGQAGHGQTRQWCSSQSGQAAWMAGTSVTDTTPNPHPG